ncbi:MAG: hypothetical protein ACYC40_01225 [Patescibacteria group bacterium]
MQQFNNLPKDLRNQVSSSNAMLILTELENKYKLDLAMIVMKVMIKNIAVKNLPVYFISECGLSREASEELTRELKEKIFIGVAEYLGITADIRALDLEKDIRVIIAEAGLTLSSSELINRFKNILALYLKGIRAKIDTRAVLAREVISGGVNLSPVEIDRVFKVCDTSKFKSLDIVAASSIKPNPSSASRLDKIINSSDNKLASTAKLADYNLKEALASGQIKKPALLNLPVEEKILKLEENLKIDEAPKAISKELPKEISKEAPKEAPKEISKETPREVKLNPVAPIKTPAAPQTIQEPKTPITSSQTAQVKTPIKPVILTNPVSARQNIETDSKHPSMHDIKPIPKVMGPIEELQFFDVINFRRLSKDPVEATTKIFNKIKLLEKEGYDKMVAGVKAWRQSPVNRLYIKIGQEAISKGITIKDAAIERQKNNPEYLKIEEIEALVNLNSKLVF